MDIHALTRELQVRNDSKIVMLVADGLGFMFQDRGKLYALEPGHPNVYAPGKRPFQMIIPAFVLKDGKPFMSFGVMGGDM